MVANIAMGGYTDIHLAAEHFSTENDEPFYHCRYCKQLKGAEAEPVSMVQPKSWSYVGNGGITIYQKMHFQAAGEQYAKLKNVLMEHSEDTAYK